MIKKVVGATVEIKQNDKRIDPVGQFFNDSWNP